MADINTQRIHAILLGDWDPLGVDGNPHLSDEYDRYVPDILRLIESHYSLEQLVEHLGRIETETVGLEPSPQETRKAAAAVLARWKAENER